MWEWRASGRGCAEMCGPGPRDAGAASTLWLLLLLPPAFFCIHGFCIFSPGRVVD